MASASDFADFHLTDSARQRYGVEPDWHFAMERRVRWNEVDGFGHVNNAAYMLYFEDARNTYLECAGLAPLHTDKPGPVLARSQEDYIKALRFEDVILVTARTARIGRTSLVMQYGVWCEGAVARGEAVCVLMVNATGEKTPIPEGVRIAIDRNDPQPGRASGSCRE